MAGNTVYVQGSYVDVHDNEVVNLSIDKAEVQVDGKVLPAKLEAAQGASVADDATACALTGKLNSEEATVYWKQLQKAGFVDANCQLLPETTRKQAMYIAEAFAEKLGITSKWKTFERLWGISNLAQEKWDFQQTGTMPPRSKEIDDIFSD